MRHIFEPDELHRIANNAVGLPFDEMVRTLIDELERTYPGQIDAQPEWLLTMAAGYKGWMAVLHASLGEYLIIFGNPIPTSGFSGRWRLDIHDFMLAGEQWECHEDNPGERHVFGAGDRMVLERGAGKLVAIADSAWMLEYARGPIATALPIGMADSLLSCGDFATVRKTMKIYNKLTMNALRKRRS